MLTVKDLRNLLKGLNDEQPVVVCLCEPDDAAKLIAAAEADEDVELIHVKVPLALPVAWGCENDDGGILLFVCSPESQEE